METSSAPPGSKVGSQQPKSLLDLPEELVLHLVNFLTNIEDFHRLSCTCKVLQRQVLAATPNTLLRLAARSESNFFRPHNYLYRPAPYLVIAATARQLSEWATKSSENAQTLRRAFRGGVAPYKIPELIQWLRQDHFTDLDSEGCSAEILPLEYNDMTLLDLCVEHCGLTMDDIRRLYEYKKTTIDPVIDFLDKCEGQQWLDTPDFWYGAVSDPENREDQDFDMAELFYALATYGSLFASSFDAYLDPEKGAKGLDIETRLDFLKYCVPDSSCWGAARWHDFQKVPRSPGGGPHEWLKVVDEPVYETIDFNERNTDPQILLRHLLRRSRWRRAWRAVRATAGGDFEEQWRQRLWEAVVMTQGFEGMEMIGGLGPGAWKEELAKWRARIESLGEQPNIIGVGQEWSVKLYTPEYPWLRGELQICTFGWYGGGDFEVRDAGFDSEGEFLEPEDERPRRL